MKVHRTLPLLAALLAAPVLAQSRPAAPAQETPPGAEPRWTIATRGPDGEVEVREFEGPELPKDGPVVVTRGIMVGRAARGPAQEADTLNAAANVLAERGYADEAARLREIAQEVRRGDAARAIEARASELLEGDVSDKAVRVAMLDVVADGYELAGWETNAATMKWFADVGRSQLPGGEPVTRPVPDNVRTSSSQTMMGALTEIVRTGARAQRELGNENGASVCLRLAAFYEARDAGVAAEDAGSDEEPPEEVEPTPRPLRGIGYVEDPGDRSRDLTYIEGRVPVLRLARNAYGLEGGGLSEDERALGLAWMEWMVVSGQNRVQEEQVELPPLPGAVSMDGIIETIRKAGDIYDDNRRPREAKRCRDLAEYYEKRSRGEVDDNSANPPRRADVRRNVAVPVEPAPAEVAPPAMGEGADLARRRAALQEQIRELEKQIIDLQKQLEARRRRGGGGGGGGRR
jgi:hypothetical protein